MSPMDLGSTGLTYIRASRVGDVCPMTPREVKPRMKNLHGQAFSCPLETNSDW